MSRHDDGSARAIIETDRLRLRCAMLDDSHAVLELNRDPEIIRYTGEPLMSSLADAEELIRERLLPDYARHGFGRWAMILKESGGLIGFAGLKRLEAITSIRWFKLRRSDRTGIANLDRTSGDRTAASATVMA